jgi:hypothetical protein
VTVLLKEALDAVRTLPEDEQDRAAQALFAFVRELNDYSFDDDQITGIDHDLARCTMAGSRGM